MFSLFSELDTFEGSASVGNPFGFPILIYGAGRAMEKASTHFLVLKTTPPPHVAATYSGRVFYASGSLEGYIQKRLPYLNSRRRVSLSAAFWLGPRCALEGSVFLLLVFSSFSGAFPYQLSAVLCFPLGNRRAPLIFLVGPGASPILSHGEGAPRAARP